MDADWPKSQRPERSSAERRYKVRRALGSQVAQGTIRFSNFCATNQSYLGLRLSTGGTIPRRPETRPRRHRSGDMRLSDNRLPRLASLRPPKPSAPTRNRRKLSELLWGHDRYHPVWLLFRCHMAACFETMSSAPEDTRSFATQLNHASIIDRPCACANAALSLREEQHGGTHDKKSSGGFAMSFQMIGRTAVLWMGISRILAGIVIWRKHERRTGQAG